jgi:hypothetical protein
MGRRDVRVQAGLASPACTRTPKGDQRIGVPPVTAIRAPEM